MSGVQALSLILLWQAAFPCVDAALTISVSTPQRAELGKDIFLQCSFRWDGSINPQFLLVLWVFQGKEVVRFDNKGSSAHLRRSINTQDAPKGIADMWIKNVTITDIGQYRCMVIYSTEIQSRGIYLTVYASPSVIFETLETEDMTYALCSVTGFYPRDISVDILRDDTITKDSVLSDYHTNAEGTYSVNKTWKIPSDVSLKTSCVVYHETSYIQKDLRLVNQASPSVTIDTVETEDMTYALCSVTGFYPRDISVDILRDDTITKDSVLSDYHTNANGTYSVNKTWKIPSDVSPKMLSCVVCHKTSHIRKDLRLVYEGRKRHIGYILGVIVFALVIGFILWIYKRKSGEKFTVCDIESPVLMDGEKTSLSCKALHSSGEVQVSWSIKLEDGTQIEVSDTDLGDNEEGQHPVSREYQVTKDCQTSPNHMTTKLTFIPSISRHMGATVSCKIVHQKRSEEKLFDIRTIYGEKFTVCDIESPVLIDGEKTTLSCKALHSSGEVQVTWTIKLENGTQIEVSDTDLGDNKEGQPLLSREYQVTKDCLMSSNHMTTKLTFIPSISRHLGSTVSCKILHQKRSEEKTFDIGTIYAKPQFTEPVQITLCDGGDVQLSVTLQRFYPQELEVSWFSRRGQSEEKIPSEDTPSHSGMTFDLESKCSVSGELFKDPSYKVIVRWRHGSMEESQSREISVREFPWKANVQDILVPNLLDGSTATLKCEVSNVFPDVLSVRWLKKKDRDDVFPLIHNETYNISELRAEKQKDNTFMYKSCMKFKPSMNTDDGAEIICRVEHPTLEGPAEKSTGPLTIKEEKRLIVGDIQGPTQWIHGEKTKLSCPLSYCCEDTRVMWMVNNTDGSVEEISDTRGDPATDSDYMISEDKEESDKGLVNIISSLTFIPSVSKHLGVTITCRVLSDGETKTKEFKPNTIYATPQVVGPVKTSLCDGGDVLCSLILQNFYPKHMKFIWKSGEKQLKSTEEYDNNDSGTYNGHSDCIVPGHLLTNPNFSLEVTWNHKSLVTPQSQVLSWKDLGLSWRPVIEEVPISHVLIERWNTLQYNISQYFPDDVTVRWYRKERGGQEYVPLSHDGKYQIPDIQHHRQTDLTFSCTARLLYKPSVGDRGSEIMCTVSHPSLEEPTERRSGPLQVQAKPKVRKPIKPSLGPGEVIFSQMLENFYPKTIQVEWCYWSGEEPVQSCQSQEKYTTNINKTVSVTSECRVPEHLLCSPKFRVRVTWRHESMDEEEYREFSIRRVPAQHKLCIRDSEQEPHNQTFTATGWQHQDGPLQESLCSHLLSSQLLNQHLCQVFVSTFCRQEEI